jgi:hypothetical protein
LRLETIDEDKNIIIVECFSGWLFFKENELCVALKVKIPFFRYQRMQILFQGFFIEVEVAKELFKGRTLCFLEKLQDNELAYRHCDLNFS